MARRCWVQHPVTGELIPKDQYVRPGKHEYAAVHGDIEAFVSPIDGSVIADRRQLREHNIRHGVTNVDDYGPSGGKDWFERKHRERSAELMCNTRKAKAERVEALQRALYQAGVRD